MSNVVAVEKDLARIAKGSDKRDDALMLMSAECNWSQLLTPAPSTISLLGQLMLIFSDTDFSLDDKPPEGGFKLLKYPNSFRASLVQVSNTGWFCFNLAHVNMEQIQLHCSNVDSHLKTAVRFLLRGTQLEIEEILPLSLNKIKNIADECLLLSQEVEKKFVDMMELIGELLEASTSTKGIYEKKLKETEIALSVAKTEKTRLESNLKASEKRLKKMDEEVTNAQSDFKDAMDSIPSSGELFGLQLGDVFVGAVRSIVSVGGLLATNAISSGGIPAGLASLNPFSKGASTSSTATPTTLEDSLSTHAIYTQVRTIYDLICKLFSMTTSNSSGGNTPSLDLKRVSTGEADRIKESINRALDRVKREKGNEPLRSRVSDVCIRTTSICDDLIKYSRSLASTDESVISQTLYRMEDLQRKAQILNAEAQKNNGVNPLDRKSPYLSKMQPQGSDGSLAQNAISNARFKTTLAKETLKDAKRRQEKSADLIQKINDSLTKVMKEMAKLNIEEVDFETIRDTLVKGIIALAELREQWGKLVHFFQMLASIIKCCLNTSLKAFVDQAEIGRKLKIGDNQYKLSNIFRDVIFEHASKCSQVSYIVGNIAGTYVEISKEYIMPKITGLGGLVALNDKHKIQKEQMNLHYDLQKAQAAIKRIAVSHQERFNKEIDERIAKIVDLEKKLPLDEQKVKEMKDAVAGVFNTNEMNIDEVSFSDDEEDYY